MPRQFDVYRRKTGALVLIVQDDALDHLRTRVVVPLLPGLGPRSRIRVLNPTVVVLDTQYTVAVEFPAAATLEELGSYVVSCPHLRDDIIRALDLLFTGV